jgi:CheY-like chemotaxis protein
MVRLAIIGIHRPGSPSASHGRGAFLMIERRTRVLVVDDNLDCAELLAELLGARGLDVAIAGSPSAALALLSTFSPEVALLDLDLPEMSGYELAGRIRQSIAGCRFIAVTGYADSGARARSRELAFAAHLVKPISVDQILLVIADRQ